MADGEAAVSALSNEILNDEYRMSTGLTSCFISQKVERAYLEGRRKELFNAVARLITALLIVFALRIFSIVTLVATGSTEVPLQQTRLPALIFVLIFAFGIAAFFCP